MVNIISATGAITQSIRSRWRAMHRSDVTFTLTHGSSDDDVVLCLDSDMSPDDFSTLQEVAWAAAGHELRARGVLRSAPELAPCTVDVDSPFAHLPCASVDGPAFREALWRQTGADVPGEQAMYSCACGAAHAVRLLEGSSS